MIDTTLFTARPAYRSFTADDRNYDEDKPSIKSILWKHYDWIESLDRSGKARPCVLNNVQKTLLCNTVYLGYDYFECPNCHNFNIIYRKCHSRFCNSCGVKTQKILAEKAQFMCVDVPHRHIVFTIPENYRIFFRKDRTALDLLFIAARNTICKSFNENLYRKEKRRRSKSGKLRNKKDNLYLYRNFSDANDFGMIATLHTFGRDLKWNPHIHALVPQLSYNANKDTCQRVNYIDYKSLRKTFQYELNRLLSDKFGDSFRKIINSNYKELNNGFYVYAKDRNKKEKNDVSGDYSKNVAGCVNYMMRYAARPAMAQSRIIHYDKETDAISWYYDDHKTNERITVTETGRELLEKMFIHIPDENFRTIRYYGFYNNKKLKTLNRIHELLGNTKKISRDKYEKKQKIRKCLTKLRFRTLCMDSFNRDMMKCKCGSEFSYIDSYNPLEGVHNDRVYRQSCIDEMRLLQVRRAGPRSGPCPSSFS